MRKLPIRVALFGSYYRGFRVLRELIDMQAEGRPIQVVGVASDDPSQNFINAGKRVWRYGHTEDEARMVPRLAADNHIPVYTGRVKSDEFYRIFENRWRPDICYVATFGQLIDRRLLDGAPLGFFNLHPSTDRAWPSYAGGDPFKLMFDAGEDYCVITLHQADEQFDHGEIVEVSERIIFPASASVPDMHKLTSPSAAVLVREHLSGLLAGH